MTTTHADRTEGTTGERERSRIPGRDRGPDVDSGSTPDLVGEEPVVDEHPLVGLQREAGNRATQRLLRSDVGIQPKLRVGQPNDRYEREADRVARAVARLSSWPVEQSSVSGETTETATPRIQRLCTRCRGRLQQGQPLDCPDCERTLQRSPSAAGDLPIVNDEVAGEIGHARGGGQPLPPSTRAFFESRFGHEFDDVRVHDGPRAARLNRAFDARAFTLGRDVFFGASEYRPESAGGRELLAHELTHVVQQRPRSDTGKGVVRRQPVGSEPICLPVEQENVCTVPPVAESEPVAVTTPPEGSKTTVVDGWTVADDTAYNVFQLRQVVARDGLEGLEEFKQAFDRQVQQIEILLDLPGGVPDTDPDAGVPTTALPNPLPDIAPHVDAAYEKVQQEGLAFLGRFRRSAREVLSKTLDESEVHIKAEMHRYGIGDLVGEIMEGKGVWYVQPGTDTSATRGMVAAAKLLAQKAKEINRLRDERESLVGHSPYSPGSFVWDYEKYDRLTERIEVRERDFDVYRAELTREYPILATYFSKEGEADVGDLEDIGEGFTRGIRLELAMTVADKLGNIQKVREEIGPGGDVNVWKLPQVVGMTKAVAEVEGDPFRDRLVEEKVEDEEWSGTLWKITLGLVALGLGLLAAIPTGGGSLLAATAAIGSLAANAYIAYESYQEYTLQSALSGTTFDRARAISQNEPSLFWLAVDIVGAAAEVGPILRTGREAIRAMRSGQQTFEQLAPLAKAADAARGTEESVRATERLVQAAKAADPEYGEQLAKRLTRDQARRTAELESVREAAKPLTISGELAAANAVAAGAKIKVSPGGWLVVCSSPCRWLRTTYADQLGRNPTLEAELSALETRAARAAAEAKAANEAGDAAALTAARRRAGNVASDAVELERKLRLGPSGWQSPLAKSDPTSYFTLLERRTTAARTLDHRPSNWSGALEAQFRGYPGAEEGYRWVLQSDGTLRYDRVRTHLPDGSPVPERAYDDVKDEFVDVGAVKRAAFVGEGERLPLSDLPPSARAEMDQLLGQRELARMERDLLEAEMQSSEALTAARRTVTESVEQIGEVAGEAYVRRHYGLPANAGPTFVGSGTGVFDQVWKVPKKTEEGFLYVVVETKGGSSGRGARTVGAQRVEQGTPEYFGGIVDAMAASGRTPLAKQIGEELQLARVRGDVRYVEVRAPIREVDGQATLGKLRIRDYRL